MKKWLSVFLTVLLILSLIPASASSEISTVNITDVSAIESADRATAEVTFSLAGLSSSAAEPVPYVALYTKQNQMIDIEAATEQSAGYAATVTLPADKDGIYGKVFVWGNQANPYSDFEPFTVSTLISNPCSLSGASYGSLIICESVGEGEVSLSDVTISGDLIIRGGGSNSIKLDSCSVSGKVIMEKESGNAPRLELTKTPIEKIEVKNEAIIETTDTASAISEVVASANIEIKGDSTIIEKVQIPETVTDGITVTVPDAVEVEVEVNTSKGVAITGEMVSVSTALAQTPENVTVGGEAAEHIHQWSAWTEVAGGGHTRSCLTAEHPQTEEHTWDEGVITQEPTETAEGVKTYTCSHCGATKTESVPVSVAVKITLVQSGNDIKAIWTGATAPSYYFKVIDENGQRAMHGWTNADECETPNIALYLPRAETNGTYSFVLYSCDESYNTVGEIARLENCFDITVAGNAVDYDIAFNAQGEGKHTITFNTLPTGIWHIESWYRNGSTDGGGCGSITSTLTESYDLQNGDIYDLRVLTSYTLDGQVVKATMTPPSKTTYVDSSATKIVLTQENDVIKATWPDYGYTKYYVKILDSKGETATYTSCYNGFYGIENIGSVLPVPTEGTETYSLVVYAVNDSYQIGEELDRLENAIEVTVSGEALAYDMAFNSPESGEHTVTLTDATLPSGVGMRRYWYNSSGSSAGHGYSGTVSASRTETKTIEDGYTYDLRIVSALSLDGQAVKATMTPPSKKTYTAATDVKITLVQDGDNIEATWTGANCDNGYTWALIEDGDIHQLDWVRNNVSTSGDFKPDLTRIESGVHSYDFVLYEYDESAEDCIGKEIARLENAIEVTIAGESVGYTMSFTAPADGQYEITLNAVPTEGDTYLTRWNRNKSNYSSIYVSDGTQTYTETTFMGALQDGDIYDLRLLTNYTLEGQTIKAVMTPPSKTTYHSQPVYIVSVGSIGIGMRVVCPLPDAPFTMASGATNLDGIVKTATLKWGDTEIITVNGNNIRYKDGLGYYFNINIGNGYDSRLEGMTLTFTPAENAGFEEFTVTNDAFVYSHTDSEEPMPQDGYTVRYSEADSKILFENLDLKANYNLIYINNSGGIDSGYTLSIDYATEDRFCINTTDWAPWSQYDGRDFSLTKTTAIIGGNSVTFETSKSVHPMNSGRYFGEVSAESPVVLNFDRGDGELKDSLFTCTTNDDTTYEKMQIYFSSPDGIYWRTPGCITTDATKTASSFISSTFSAFAGDISDLKELYLLITPENDSDTKDYPQLLKIKRERGNDIVASELNYSFVGNTDYYYELFATTETGATSRLNPSVAEDGTVSGHINADMVNPAVYSWDGNFTKEDDGTYSIAMTYQLLKTE